MGESGGVPKDGHDRRAESFRSTCSGGFDGPFDILWDRSTTVVFFMGALRVCPPLEGAGRIFAAAGAFAPLNDFL